MHIDIVARLHTSSSGPSGKGRNTRGFLSEPGPDPPPTRSQRRRPAHAHLTTLLRPRPQVSSPPLGRIIAFASLLRRSQSPLFAVTRYLTVLVVLSPSPIAFHATRTRPILISAAHRIALPLSPVTRHLKHPQKTSHSAILELLHSARQRRTRSGAPIADSWPSLLLNLGLLIP